MEDLAKEGDGDGRVSEKLLESVVCFGVGLRLFKKGITASTIC
jgi:hypothetical protein